MDQFRNKTSYSLNGPEMTRAYAATIGRRLKGGEVIELIADFGGGKTTFTQGLAAGAGSKDIVTSPSFTIRNDYRSKNFLLAHFDFYRLNDPGILKDMLAEAMDDPLIVVVIEWANVVESVLPSDVIRLKFKTLDVNRREIELNYPKRFAYLFEEET
ncbi:tRNA (adenosine(37)-N6)-threonylcarbamoyltransferase complex ATPase subunit type 1 TsaE [Patescibacteria group bacterium]|nr:tRNA (adenosine(37)-N6)-threonylcarbamoyltransferase complex ATPase subunit type 1 TsaE [Patescibacteria group bacterium]